MTKTSSAGLAEDGHTRKKGTSMKIKCIKVVAATCVLSMGMNTLAGTVAYWQGQDGAPGTTAAANASLKTQVNSPSLDAKVCPDGKTRVAFSADVPGKVIVSGADVVNSNNTGSLKSTAIGGKTPALTVAGNETLNTKSFTVEAFVKIEKAPKWGEIMGKLRVGGFSWLVQQAADSGLSRGRVDSQLPKDPKRLGYNQGTGNSKAKIFDNSWHHLAITYDAQTQMFALYADYQLQTSKKTTLPVFLDNRPLFFFNGISGLIDEMRISDVALAPADFLKIKQ
jgi:hypothetical protein